MKISLREIKNLNNESTFHHHKLSINLGGKNLTDWKIIKNRLVVYKDRETVAIYPLKGITAINFSGNKFRTLPPLPETLEELLCTFNELEVLPELPKSLKSLDCRSNRLTTLPQLPESLTILYCYRNHLSRLPTLPKALQELYCYDNFLEFLPELPTSLAVLQCQKNQLCALTNLPYSLDYLDCKKNPLKFVAPLKNPRCYRVPPQFKYLRSEEWFGKYQTYLYLITFLVLDAKILPVILSNPNFHFTNF